jgi:hypothetical protein
VTYQAGSIQAQSLFRRLELVLGFVMYKAVSGGLNPRHFDILFANSGN